MFQSKIPVIACALLLILAYAAPAYSQDNEDQATRLFIRGLTALYNTDYEGAISLFEDAVALRPNDGAILSALSEAFTANGDVSAALFYAQAATTAVPDEPSVHRQLADLYLVIGNQEAAIESLERVVSLSPRDSEALRILARTQYQSGLLEDALVSYHRLLDYIGESAAIRYRLYQIYQQTGDHQNAAETLEVLIDLNPDEPTLRQELVNLWISLEETENAITTLEDLLRLTPNNEEARIRLAELYSLSGDPEAAFAVMEGSTGTSLEAEYTRLVLAYTENPEDPAIMARTREGLEAMLVENALPPNGYVLLGEIRLKQEDYELAAEILTASLDIIAPHPYPLELLAEAHFLAGNNEAAAGTADDGLLLFPGHVTYLYIGTNAHMALGNSQKALDYALLALEILEEDSPDAVEIQSSLWGLAGMIYAELEQVDNSDEAHAAAIRLDPDNAMALNNFAWFLAEREIRLDEALAMATRAVELNPTEPSFINTLGWAYHKQGNQPRAIQYLRQAADLALEQGGSAATYLEYLGKAYLANGDHAEARAAWQRALELEPNRRHLELEIQSLP